MISSINTVRGSSKIRAELVIEVSNVGVFGDFDKRAGITENR